jgi:hypothetical protein
MNRSNLIYYDVSFFKKFLLYYIVQYDLHKFATF